MVQQRHSTSSFCQCFFSPYVGCLLLDLVVLEMGKNGSGVTRMFQNILDCSRNGEKCQRCHFWTNGDTTLAVLALVDKVYQDVGGVDDDQYDQQEDHHQKMMKMTMMMAMMMLLARMMVMMMSLLIVDKGCDVGGGGGSQLSGVMGRPAISRGPS